MAQTASTADIRLEGTGPSPTVGLRRGAIGRLESAAIGLAYIAPAAAVFIVYGAVTADAGTAIAFVMLMAAVAFAFHVNTVAEFNRTAPSPGFYVSYIAKSLGGSIGGIFSVIYPIGVLGILATVVMGLGLWVNYVLVQLTGFHLSWWIPAVVLELVIGVMAYLGIRLSVRIAVTLFAFETLTLIVGGLAMLVAKSSFIAHSGSAFNPTRIPGGASAFGLAFTLAIFLYSGTTASSALSDEVREPRRNIPVAVFMAITLAMILYVFAAWTLGIGFGESTSAILHATFPFVAGSTAAAGPLRYFMYLAGFTSASAVCIAVSNVLPRVVYSFGRAGLLPRRIAHVHPRKQTPDVAIVVVVSVSIILTLLWGGIAGGGFGFTGGFVAYAEIAGLATDFLVLTFIVANFGLPVHYWKNHRELFSWWRHVIAPFAGTVLLAYPFWESVKPTQPRPYNWFGLVLIGFVVIGGLVAWYARRRAVDIAGVISSE